MRTHEKLNLFVFPIRLSPFLSSSVCSYERIIQAETFFISRKEFVASNYRNLLLSVPFTFMFGHTFKRGEGVEENKGTEVQKISRHVGGTAPYV